MANDPYVYQTEPLGMGDPIRVALSGLQRNIEAFLFDKRYVGYANPDFLSWALEHSKVTASATGTLSNAALRWSPKFYENLDPSIDAEPDSDNPARFYDGTIRYAKPDFSTDADAPAERPLHDHEVTRPEFARHVSGNAVVVPEHAPDAPDHDESTPDHDEDGER